MYDVRTGRLAATLGGHLEAATDVSFSPLHPQLATASLDTATRASSFADADAASRRVARDQTCLVTTRGLPEFRSS